MRPLLAATLLLAAGALHADDDDHHDHSGALEEIVVHGHPLSAEGLATPVDSVEGEELERKMADSIGAIVEGQPGIHNSSYGVAVGRPVIHGLGGARVRVMEDRIDVMDASVTSGDHAVTIDPFVVDGVEIFKGSGTLLYGSGAIGGVVDTHTGRIPHGARDVLSGKLDLKLGDNANARSGSFRLDGGAGQFAWHFDGFARRADDYEIPGYAESALFRALEEEHGEEHGEEGHEDEDGDHEDDEEEPFGVVPGSYMDVRGGAFGFSYVGDRGFAGLAVSRLDSEYGIPAHGHEEFHSEDEHEEHGPADEEEEEEHGHEGEGFPFIDLNQTRVDFEAALLDPLPGFSSFNLRAGTNDYEHFEIEPSGEIGTVFDSQAWEARAELSHGPLWDWTGAIGTQISGRSLSVVGEEAHAPPVDTRSLGVFWVGERSFEDFELEGGVRVETVEHSPVEGADRDFSLVSASLGAIIPLHADWTAAVQADYSTRAPVGEELFSDGPHVAAQSFEIGHPGLEEENALNLSVTLNGDGPNWSVAGTFYYTSFGDFIYLASTGEVRRELVVLQFLQGDAVFRGLDLEASMTLAEWGDARLRLTGLYDVVSAKLDTSGNEYLPRIPPQRFGAGLEFTWGAFRTNIDYLRTSRQDKLGDHELPTAGYEDLRAYISYDIERGSVLTQAYLRSSNLTGDEQRKHTSIIKDRAPAPDRTIEAGVRLRF